MDRDGFGDVLVSTDQCGAGGGFVANSADCDDANPVEHPGQSWYADCDGDSFARVLAVTACDIAEAESLTPCSDGNPPDGGWAHVLGTDCHDDTIACGSACNPGLSEGPPLAGNCFDAFDNDCDGSTDTSDSGCLADLCEYITWGSTNGGTIEWAPAANLLDGRAAGRTFAVGDWSGAASRAQIGGFTSSGRTEQVVAVDAIIAYWISARPIDDVLRFRTLLGGAPQGAPVELPSSRLSRARSDVPGITTVDVTAQRAWSWSDFDAALVLELENIATAADDGSTLYVDAAGYNVTYRCNAHPTALLTASPIAGDTTTVFSLDASASNDADDIALTVRWDWASDGTWDTLQTTVLDTTYSFATAGFHLVAAEIQGGPNAVVIQQRIGVVPSSSQVFLVDTEFDETTNPTALSLREAILAANVGPELDLILFDGPMTIAVSGALGELPSINSEAYVFGNSQVEIDGSGLSSGSCLVVEAAGTAIVGLTVHSCPGAAVVMSGPDTLLIDSIVWGSGEGVLVEDADVTIGPGNHIAAHFGSGVVVLGEPTDRTVIRGNRIGNNGTDGITVAVGADSGQIEQNFISINAQSGLGTSGTDIRSLQVRHNTFYNNAFEGVRLGADVALWDIRNNIFVGHATAAIDPLGAPLGVLDYNLFYANAADCLGCPMQPNAVFLDPLFVDFGSGDLRLTPLSPAKDAGVDLIDLNGLETGSFNGGGPDIGAHEMPR